MEFRSCSSPVLPLHKCLQITGLTSHASHTDALSDGVAPFSAYLVGIRSGLPLAVYTLAPALDLVVPGRFDFYFIFLSSLFSCPTHCIARLFSYDDHRRWRSSCLRSLTLAESFFLGDMKSRKSANPPEYLRLGAHLARPVRLDGGHPKIATRRQDSSQIKPGSLKVWGNLFFQPAPGTVRRCCLFLSAGLGACDCSETRALSSTSAGY